MVFAVNAPATLSAPFATVLAVIVTPLEAATTTVFDDTFVNSPLRDVLPL